MWAVELLGEEPPRDTRPRLKVPQADHREEPSSTHQPGKEGARPARPIGRGRKGPVTGQGEKCASLHLTGGTKKGQDGSGQNDTPVPRYFPQTQPWLRGAVSLCLLVKDKGTFGGAVSCGVMPAFARPLRHWACGTG